MEPWGLPGGICLLSCLLGAHPIVQMYREAKGGTFHPWSFIWGLQFHCSRARQATQMRETTAAGLAVRWRRWKCVDSGGVLSSPTGPPPQLLPSKMWAWGLPQLEIFKEQLKIWIFK